ncbi:MAG: HAD hydrolase-like protein [Flavobacteriales bacterium]|nr:HAD hydrolase-like protein [Flavobacteriales bacterium]
MLSDKISLVVFDMAGTTMVDNGEIEDCFLEACVQNGLNVTRPQINAMMGWSKIAVFQTFWRKKLGENHPDLEDKVEESFYTFKDLLEAHYENTKQHPTEGAVEVINWLRKNGVKVVLNTGFYREVTDIILENLGWDEGLDENYVSTGDSFIDMSITSDEVAKGRPHPFMIHKAMKQFGITDPKKVVKIGDTPVDLAEGRNAKCLFSLGVTNGSHTKAELDRLDNDGLLPTVGHLKGYLIEKLKLENA